MSGDQVITLTPIICGITLFGDCSWCHHRLAFRQKGEIEVGEGEED